MEGGNTENIKNTPPLELKTSAAPPEKYDTVPSIAWVEQRQVQMYSSSEPVKRPIGRVLF